ncbi:MAG: BREX-2 system adenine-specific DNA-methyltransferase PglX [Polyangiaceae bacterium]|nr:BREX-2 system adenine-specific DNA-methyltransferase PglX [Polyangiaceae bacterium]
MKTETYAALLKDLQKLQKAVVAAQIAAVRQDPQLGAKLERLHREAEVGGRLDDFVATAARKSAVLLLLRTVFVRVLEDLGILGLKRIRDDWGFAAFREVAPALGVRAYLAFVFRDLAVDFPALFAPSEDELPLPDEDQCRALWNLWHHPNRDGELYVWNGEGFDSRFLGDLYQDLDADIRKRYALLQTPRFVEEYILDHTLTPALAEFDPEKLWASGERFRLLDPTCGSGHFLIGTFHRLADYWRDRHGFSEWLACERALESVWGADINPHAVEIAEFRLLLEVVARTGVKELERLAALKLNLRAMDSLVPWERAARQGELFPAKDRLDAYATPKERQENAAFLGRAFHAVVGNPPYITPKDVRKRDDYRVFWPDSAAGRYALSAPFVERLFVLGKSDAFIGQITANSFMKRSFGKSLVTKALPKWDVSDVIDTSGAHIPGHGTPTTILFGRTRPPSCGQLRMVLGKRGEPKRPLDARRGLVWSAIRDSGRVPDDQSAFVTVSTVERSVLLSHPWTIGGGRAQEIMSDLCGKSQTVLHRLKPDIGPNAFTGQDSLFVITPGESRRVGLDLDRHRKLAEGDAVRDFDVDGPENEVVFSYRVAGDELVETDFGDVERALWGWRTWVLDRPVKGFKKIGDVPGVRNRLSFFYPSRLNGLRIAFAFVSTHNHFALDCGGTVFKQSAPVIKLPPIATRDDHLDLLGLLNSSTLGFWMRQVFYPKGGDKKGDGSRSSTEEWSDRLEYDSTKLQQAPITTRDRDPRVALATALDATAQERAACLPAALLAAGNWAPASLGADLSAARNRYLALTLRMVALQEELDWLTYGSYGLLDAVTTVGPDSIEPLAPGHRPFEIVLARRDDEADEDEKSAWWSRHGHDRVTEIPSCYSEPHRARLQERMDLIESDPRLALLETPPYKRRWQLADWPAETRKAAESWLLDRLEDLFAPAMDSVPRGPLAEPKPYRLEEIVAAWSHDPRVAAVAGAWTGTGASVDVTLVAEQLLRANALPDHPHRFYSSEGLRKLAEWKRVWALQDQEDVWENAAAEAKARGEVAPKLRLVDPDDPERVLDSIPLPPKFDRQDFVRPEYFSIRGKLNVPRERFILFGELSPPRYGWNGWRDRERALAQVEAYTLAENDPQQPLPLPTSDDPRRCGVTFGLWESLPDVRRWGDAEEHAELQQLAREACRQQRCPCPIIEAWRTQVLEAKATALEKAKTRAAKARPAKAVEEPEPAPTVSLAARAWVASLFADGKESDAATVWARHRSRVAEPGQQSIPGIKMPPKQLSLPVVGGAPPPELAHLDETGLARILDDLVASGDLQARGRGKKKRYLLVPRGVSS